MISTMNVSPQHPFIIISIISIVLWTVYSEFAYTLINLKQNVTIKKVKYQNIYEKNINVD